MIRGYRVGPGYAVMMVDLGIAPAVVLHRARLPESVFKQETWLTPEQFYGLWTVIDDQVPGDDLAVHVVQALTAETFNPVLFAGLCCDNLRSAATRIALHKRLIGPMELDLVETCDRLRLTMRYHGPSPPDVVVEAEVLFWLAFARIGTRKRVRPQALRLPNPRTDSARLAEFVDGAPVLRSTSISIDFTLTDAARPFVTRNSEMWSILEPELRRSLDTLTAQESTSARVSFALVESLAAGADSIAHVADELAVSPRTLQRQLAGEGATFAQILASTRERLALHYLHHTSLTNTEIALLLGFDEPSSFHRAFHLWTGQTPGSARMRTGIEAPG